jgi:predicted nuclease of predicted toxin-antitoxin system
VKLLLDENLSDRIVNRIIDLYPDSEHVKTLGLISTDDAAIWEYAKANDFAIVSKDSDFHQRSLLYGHPPKFRLYRSCYAKLTAKMPRQQASYSKIVKVPESVSCSFNQF